MSEQKADEAGQAAPFAMTDLEEKLRGPGGADHAAALLARIDVLLGQHQAALAAGVPREDFERTTKVHNSLAAARDFLVVISTTLKRG